MSKLLAFRAKSGTCAAAASGAATSADLPSMTYMLWGVMLPGASLLSWSSEISRSRAGPHRQVACFQTVWPANIQRSWR